MDKRAGRGGEGVVSVAVAVAAAAAGALGPPAAPRANIFPMAQVGDAMISVDPETRRLIVITDDETSQYVSQVITNLDRPKPQVLIKVVFLEVTYNNASDIGIEGGFNQKINNGTSGNGANVFGLSALNTAATNVSLNALGQPTQSFIPTPPGAGLYQILGQDYQVTLRAIAQAGKLEVLSRPSILDP
jgi:type II secretory pathway component GspD/PulD (secretin)